MKAPINRCLGQGFHPFNIHTIIFFNNEKIFDNKIKNQSTNINKEESIGLYRYLKTVVCLLYSILSHNFNLSPYPLETGWAITSYKKLTSTSFWLSILLFLPTHIQCIIQTTAHVGPCTVFLVYIRMTISHSHTWAQPLNAQNWCPCSTLIVKWTLMTGRPWAGTLHCTRAKLLPYGFFATYSTYSVSLYQRQYST